jgi:transglutaminase-like putative cysteine protease
MPTWIKAWLVFLKGLQRRPEDSAPFRQWVGVNVSVALIATASQLEWPFFVWPCLLLTWLGMWLSHRLRYRNNWEIKAALSIFMIVALGNFFMGLSRSYYDPREPLAELLMWLQALHSCDLPTRKDLNYSLLSALALMSVAGVLTLNLGFAFYLLAYFVTTVAALRHNVSSLISERTGWQVEKGRFEWRGAAKMGGYTLAFGTVIIFCMPRLEGFRIRALPMNWQNRLQGSSSNGNVLNPYYPSQLSKEQLRRKSEFNPEGYGGFNAIVDLQTRGQLLHQRVFQVRTNAPAYFRGLTFDEYDGQFWTQSRPELRRRTVANPPFIFFPLTQNHRDVVQIFYIDRPLANLVFFAPEPYQVFFPSSTLYQDEAGCLRSPYPLDKETVYSVVSRQSQLTAGELSRLPGRDPELRRLNRYLQLPENFSPQARHLARKICQSKTSYFERCLAICQYLQTQYTYDLTIARYPEGSDTVEHFLFQSRRGYCEHFASAMTLLCRTQGIPTRYCTGYLPGTYNPFSGFREVYGDDAHAWVECYLPGFGWMTFDPTPGSSSAPEVKDNETREERWMGWAILKYLGVPPQWLVGLALATALSLLLRATWKAWHQKTVKDPVAECLERAFSRLGQADLHLTPRARAAKLTPNQALARLIELHERAAYASQQQPSDAKVARQLLAEITSASQVRAE